jgi:aminoglycoside phosphotransferase family enzyme/predicted kinase
MDIKADLLRREAYGALRPTRVDLAETHISWVFLLDADVFKVKKPVALGFVDFRSIEQRKAACDAEVRLNARLAPHVYRGVVPIRRGDDGRFIAGGDGKVVDWAVHMVRLSDDHRADLLLARGELTGESIDAVAARIASFHAAARCDESTARLGTPDAISFNVEENFAQTRGHVAKYVNADQAEEMARWQTAFVRGHEALFAQRIAAGRVRDGHGDLRLEHVYLGQVASSADPTIIDCIEFSDRFRFADVCSDVAFLSMDLAAHRRVDLAERLLARYARDADDFDLYALVDFYESYRAYVRGKIAAIVAADGGLDSDARQRAESDARRYFLLALAVERRSMLLPAVACVGGLIASGKSTIADRVGLALSAPVVEADRTRKAILGVEATRPIDESAWQGVYDPAFTEKVYAEVLRRADVVLASGRPVVVDASFRSRAMRRAAQDLAARHHVPFCFIECRADPSVSRSRLVARAAARGVSDGRLEIFDAFRAQFETVDELAPGDHVVLDTTRPLDENMAALRARLDAWPPGFTG